MCICTEIVEWDIPGIFELSFAVLNLSLKSEGMAKYSKKVFAGSFSQLRRRLRETLSFSNLKHNPICSSS